MFFVQRIFIVLIMAIFGDFGLQWSLTHVMLLLNAVYLFEATPYLDVGDGLPDYFNAVMLILIAIFLATFSGWVPDAHQRYYNGMAFDCLLGLSFVLNFGYSMSIALKSAVLHAKRALLRHKTKQVQKQKHSRT